MQASERTWDNGTNRDPFGDGLLTPRPLVCRAMLLPLDQLTPQPTKGVSPLGSTYREHAKVFRRDPSRCGQSHTADFGTPCKSTFVIDKFDVKYPVPEEHTIASAVSKS